MIGERYGKLVVVAASSERRHRKVLWQCACDCGGHTLATTGNLHSGNSKSCGCEKRQAWVRARTSHGHTRSRDQTRTYNSWMMMRTRCHNQNFPRWKEWGGRGITVCDQWRNSFETFLADMGERPDGRTLDRIDNAGNYEPGNCRWATAKEQEANKPKHLDTKVK